MKEKPPKSREFPQIPVTLSTFVHLFPLFNSKCKLICINSGSKPTKTRIFIHNFYVSSIPFTAVCVLVCALYTTHDFSEWQTSSVLALFPSVFRSGETFIHVVYTNIRRNTTFTVLLQSHDNFTCGVKVSLKWPLIQQTKKALRIWGSTRGLWTFRAPNEPLEVSGGL